MSIGSYFSNKSTTLKSFVIFTILYMFFSLFIMLATDFDIRLAYLVWVFSIFVPQLLATMYFFREKKRFMIIKEKKIISLISTIVIILSTYIHRALSITDIPVLDIVTIIYFSIVGIGSFLAWWLIQYFLYNISEKIIGSTTIQK